MTARTAVLALATLLFVWNLWAYDLWAPDEPYFAEGAREMVVDGEWLVPHVNGTVTTDKPPLFFWLIALFSLPAGEVSSLSARLPSALAALGTVALTLRLGRRLVGERAAVLGGLVLVTAELFWNEARSCQIDALLCLLEMVALTAFALFRAGAWEGRRAGLVFWTACSLAVLAKGPVGLLVPLGIALVTLAWDRDLAAWRRFAPLAGPGVFLAVVGVWAAIATVGGGGDYSVWQAFRQHVLERAVAGMHHARPPWYFVGALPLRLLPWSVLLPAALLLGWRRRGESGHRFLLAAGAFVLAFFSIPAEKRGLYVLPAFPFLALLTGSLLDAHWPRREGSSELPAQDAPHLRWITVPLALVGLLLTAAGLAALAGMAAGTDVGPELARRAGLDDSVLAPGELERATLALALVLLAGGAAATWAGLAGRVRAAALATAATVAGAYLTATTLAYPALDPTRSARAFALEVRERTAASRAAGHRVAAFAAGNLPEPLAFYSDGVYCREIDRTRELIAHLSLGPEVWALAPLERVQRLPDRALARLEVVTTAKVSRRVYALVKNRTD
jgi:4-amino-4-deoxy-L-arabinose transferase-like glycosyltransferase